MLENKSREALLSRAYILALITIFYNFLEGVISIALGFEDETISLFGFGVDSFVEVISGIGIWHMVKRMKRSNNSNPDTFERQALLITGTAFYILTAGLTVTAIINVVKGHAPETTFWGIVISLVSILTMWLLIKLKTEVGNGLNSQAILADANCTRACMYFSLALLVASAGYELTGIGGFDSLGALAIAYFAFKEGKEAFDKRKGLVCGCD